MSRHVKKKSGYTKFFARREYSIASLSELAESIHLQKGQTWFDHTLVRQLKEDGLSDTEIIRLFYL